MMKLEKSWFTALQGEIQLPYIEKLKGFLRGERAKSYAIYPPENRVFYAFLQTPIDRVKVVIMGQDPYHGYRQAHGLSFSVPRGISIPPSLKNIYRELQSDLGITPPAHGCLEHWARQGVLLLNATLTVRAGQPQSHYGKGWETFTDAVISKLCARRDPLLFLLWGKAAKEKCKSILDRTDHPHQVLTAAHPSPYSSSGFFGCRHFSQTNQYLEKWQKQQIDWRLP